MIRTVSFFRTDPIESAMMKIVCIAASFIPSNTANSIQVVKATQAIAELGHEVTLLVPGQVQTDWMDLERHYGLQTRFKIQWVPENLVFRRYDFAFNALKLARQMAPDLIYTWVLQAGVLALWQGVPVVLELHDRVRGKVGPWLFRRFYQSKTPRRLLTNTHALKDALITDFKLDTAKLEIQVAPNGVDLERYQNLLSPEESRRNLDLPAGFTAGYTGHFYAGRGIHLMFEMAKALPAIQFLWVGGEAVDVAEWRVQIERQNIKNVTITGFVDNAEVAQYQAAAEVLLMPYSTSIAGSGGGDSAEIASPMKMFEYLAAGRAIVSSDLPVVYEVLNKENAVFCPPEDLSAWCSAISDLHADPDRCKQLGGAARSTAENFTWRARAESALEKFPSSDTGKIEQ